MDLAGRVLLRRRLRREGVLALAKLPGCVVTMEPCCGAHRRSLIDALEALPSEEDGSGIGSRVWLLLHDMLGQWRALDMRIKALDDEFAEMARNDPAARRPATMGR